MITYILWKHFIIYYNDEENHELKIYYVYVIRLLIILHTYLYMFKKYNILSKTSWHQFLFEISMIGRWNEYIITTCELSLSIYFLVFANKKKNILTYSYIKINKSSCYYHNVYNLTPSIIIASHNCLYNWKSYKLLTLFLNTQNT